MSKTYSWVGFGAKQKKKRNSMLYLAVDVHKLSFQPVHSKFSGVLQVHSKWKWGTKGYPLFWKESNASPNDHEHLSAYMEEAEHIQLSA